MTDLARSHDELRPLLFSIAYRMLGSVTEAEDVVQEAFLRMHRSITEGEQLASAEAFAVTVTTRLAIDTLRSARVRREAYVGEWLPEPLLADDPDPAHRLEADETVSIAFLTVLEQLSPPERAVFVLREVFDYPYAQVAEIVDHTEVSCRQLMSRARRRLDDAPPRRSPGDGSPELLEAFFAALRGEGLEELEQLLAADVVFHADAGGKARAISRPLAGRTPVARFLSSLVRRGADWRLQVEPATANGQPAALLRGPDGALLTVLTLDLGEASRIETIRHHMNPDKLGHLGPVGDLAQMARSDAEERTR